MYGGRPLGALVTVGIRKCHLSTCLQMFDSMIVGTPLHLRLRKVAKLLPCSPKGCKLRFVYIKSREEFCRIILVFDMYFPENKMTWLLGRLR